MAKQSHSKQSTLLAGAALVDITPPPGTFINGDFIAHYAVNIHDNLYAKTLVLQSGKITLAFVVVDICYMAKEYTDNIRRAIETQTGIPFQHILVSSTHTHGAGSVASVYLTVADLLYMEKLPPLIVQAVVQAAKNLRPATLAVGSVDVPEHVRCRRYFMHKEYTPLNPVTGSTEAVKTNPFGVGHLIIDSAATPDPQVSYLAVKGTDGAWISVLANYSLHYVGDWENGTITADYFGVFARQLQSKLQAGHDFVGIMSNGTSGDINIWDFQNTGNYPAQHFQKSELIGNDIAEKVFQSLNGLQWQVDPVLEVAYDEVPVKVRKASDPELQAAKKIISKSNYENLQPDEKGLRSIYAREQVLLHELPDELLFPVHAIKIGDAIVGGLAGEIFAATGLLLKAQVGVKKYFTICLANGNIGYVPPAAEMDRGGYETWRSRASKLEAAAEEKIRNKMLELVSTLF